MRVGDNNANVLRTKKYLELTGTRGLGQLWVQGDRRQQLEQLARDIEERSAFPQLYIFSRADFVIPYKAVYSTMQADPIPLHTCCLDVFCKRNLFGWVEEWQSGVREVGLRLPSSLNYVVRDRIMG